MSGAADPHTLAESYAGAAQVVARVMGGASLTPALIAQGERRGRPALRAAIQDLSYRTLRAYGTPQALSAQLVTRPIADAVLLALLYVTLVDLRADAARAHTIVDQAVEAAGRLGRVAAKGLVNAVLRNYLRRRDALEAAIAKEREVRHGLPGWWIDALRESVGEHWESVAAFGNTPPPMTLRVNRRRISREDYRARLLAAGLDAEPVGAFGLVLVQPVSVDRLPGFHAGEVSVQDAGAQRAAALLDLRDGLRVLDACAAPGGKTGDLLETAAVDLVALDNDAARVARIDENLRRLRLAARLLTGDAATPDAWWDSRPFDRVLCDVPCSASGVVRRHPDMKWLRRKSDLAGFAAQQGAILEALWRVVRPGGKLLYVTCSVFREENGERIAAFLARHPDAVRVALPDLPSDGQLLPSAVSDGFFYALLEKR